MSLKIFHASVAALNMYALWYDQMYVDLPFPSKDIEALSFKARYIFLTVWCLILQTVYFTISFLNDIFGTDAASPKHPPFIRRLRDVLFSLAFTAAIYVSMTFWGLYAINKDFIMPEEIESVIPPWVNHVMHTTIAPFIVIELLVTKRNYPSRSVGINLTLLFFLAYTSMVFFTYFTTGVWVYPFMNEMSWAVMFVFFVASAAVALGIYVVGEKFNFLVSPSSKAYANGVNGHTKKQ